MERSDTTIRDPIPPATLHAHLAACRDCRRGLGAARAGGPGSLAEWPRQLARCLHRMLRPSWVRRAP